MSEGAATPTPTSSDSSTLSESTKNESGQTAVEAKSLTASQKEKFQYVIDGETVEEEIDFSDKAALKSRLQKSYAADKRLSEAKDLKKKLNEGLATMQSPEAYIKSLGPRAREYVEKFLVSEIHNDMKTPEEKEYEMTKAELAKYKEQEKQAKEVEEKQKVSAQEAKYAQEFQTTIISALEKSQLPKTPDLVKRMAYIMSKNLELGLDLSPDELAAEVRAEQQAMLQSISKDASAEQILAMLGPDLANKIRKYDLEKLKAKRNQVVGPGKAQVFEKKEEEPRTWRTLDEWKESLGK